MLKYKYQANLKRYHNCLKNNKHIQEYNIIIVISIRNSHMSLGPYVHMLWIGWLFSYRKWVQEDKHMV